MFRRALVATVAAATLGGLAVLPAYASPEDGEGCAGLPSVPAAYVCLVSVTPTGPLPGVTTSTIPVSVPVVCYVAGCTAATTVNVPVPDVQPGSGNIAVIWYQGISYPIGAGVVGEITTVVNGVVNLAATTAGQAAATATGLAGQAAGIATDTAGQAAGIVTGTAGQAAGIVTGTAGQVVGIVTGALDDAPTAQEIVALAIGLVQPTLDDVQERVDALPTAAEIEAAIEATLRDATGTVEAFVQNAVPPIADFVAEKIDALPTAGEIGDQVLAVLRDDAAPIAQAVIEYVQEFDPGTELYDVIRDALRGPICTQYICA